MRGNQLVQERRKELLWDWLAPGCASLVPICSQLGHTLFLHRSFCSSPVSWWSSLVCWVTRVSCLWTRAFFDSWFPIFLIGTFLPLNSDTPRSILRPYSFAFWKRCKTGVIPSVIFRGCLLPLSMIPWRFIQVVAWIKKPFFFIAE